MANGEKVKECPINVKDVKMAKCPFTGKHARVQQSKDDSKQCPHSPKVAAPSHSSDYRASEEGISKEGLKEVFPFHVLVSRDFKIVQVGQVLPKVLETAGEDLQGLHIQEVFMIIRPVMAFSWDWESMNSLSDQQFFLTPTFAGMSETRKAQNIGFKASMYNMSENRVLFSLCPNIKNLQHLNHMGLTLSDMSLVTAQRDAVFLGEYVSQEAMKTNALEALSKDLKSEQVGLTNYVLFFRQFLI